MTAPVEPIPIDPGPAVPTSADPEATFDAMFEAFLAWQKNELQPGANALAAAAYTNALAAQEQAELAVTGGAAQVLLAAEQAALATSQADISAAQAVIAAEQADAARAIVNFVGVWGALTGPLNKPATTYHEGVFYALLNDLVDVTASEPGVSADWLVSSATPTYAYADRGLLRGGAGQLAIVEGLGLFRHASGSDEPDDDESCFATSTGRWLLEAPHWDVVRLWQLPDDAARDAHDGRWPGRVLRGTATCAITSVATVASTSFTGTVLGADVGDRVLASPKAELGATAADTGRLAFHAYVSAPHTVTVVLTNASAAAATINAAVQTAWPLIVFKES